MEAKVTVNRKPSKKPEGVITRGKTAPNRLRRVDNFTAMYDPDLIARKDEDSSQALFVDLGYGADAITTLESAERLRRLNPHLRILGVEIDKERVEAALPFADKRTFFRLGGFNLPLLPGETVRLIRAFNVLRQYEEADFTPAYERFSHYVMPGGLMIEGTSDPYGRIWVANVARKLSISGGSGDHRPRSPSLTIPRVRPILVTSALPYANGSPHFGHMVGSYLPADIFVR